MVPVAGLEPALPNGKGILNPSCLPIPPHRHHCENFGWRLPTCGAAIVPGSQAFASVRLAKRDGQSRAEVRSAIQRMSLLAAFLPRLSERQFIESPFCNVVGSTHLWFSAWPSMNERLNAPL